MKPPLRFVVFSAAALCAVVSHLASFEVRAQEREEEPAVPAQDARLLVCDDGILCLASDGGHIYTGHLWGIGVRDSAGALLRRWPLGLRVDHLAYCQGRVFAGTNEGLLQVDPATGVVERVGLNWGPPNPEAVRPGQFEPHEDREPIRAMMASDKILWVGTVNTLRRFEPAKKTVRVYTEDILGLAGRRSSPHVDFILADEDGAWVEAFSGILRMDNAGEVKRYFHAEKVGFDLCGATKDSALAVAQVDARGVRPCKLDVKTGIAKFYYFGGNEAEDRVMLSSDLSLAGRAGKDEWVFEGERGRRVVLREDKLEEAGTELSFQRLAARKVSLNHDTCQWVVDLTEIDDAPPEVRAQEGVRWQAEFGPEGLRLIGASNQGKGHPTYFDGNASPRQNRSWATERDSDGLWLRRAPAGWVKASAATGPESLPCDAIYTASVIRSQVWLCGPGGVVVAEPDGTIVKRYTVADGLPTNRVYQVAELGGAIYAACGSSQEDSWKGSLAVLSDGAQKFNKILIKDMLTLELGDLLGVAACGDELKLTFADAKEVRGEDPATHRGLMWHPVTRVHRKATLAEMKEGPRPMVAFSEGTVPLLEGRVAFQLTVGEHQWVGGSRGACVWSGQRPALQVPAMVYYRHIKNPAEAWSADTRLAQVPQASVRQLGVWLADSNRLLRARALAALATPTKAQLRKGLSDSYFVVREAALWQVLQNQTPLASALLKETLQDADPKLHTYIVLGLLERGEMPPLEDVKKMVTRGDVGILHSHNPKYEQRYAESNILRKAVSDNAPPAVLEMLMEPGLRGARQGFDDRDLPGLGRVLAQDPAMLERLMTDEMLASQEELRQFDHRFLMRVAKLAGTAVLPVVHPWLTAPDFRRRIAAAEICGGVHDAASFEPLLAAFASDDGLALEPITLALGEMRDVRAIPALIELYPAVHQEVAPLWAIWGTSPPVWIRDEKLWEKSADKGRGFQTIHLPDGTVAKRYNLYLGDLPKGARPVFPYSITEAIERIGPEHALPFCRKLYRKLRSPMAMYAVARGLRPSEGPEREEDIAVLRKLLQDTDRAGQPSETSLEAAHTLLLFGIRDGESRILLTLQGSDGPEARRTMERLRQVPREQRAFADEALRSWKTRNRDYVVPVRLVEELLR